MINSYELITNVFGPEGVKIRDQCIKFYHFQLFLDMFLSESLSYVSASMLVINCIKYKVEGKTEIYVFASLMFSESSLVGNQLAFEDLNVVQIGIDKKDA